MKLSKKELITFAREQQRIFDIVRLVEISMAVQYSISDEGTFIEEAYECYAVWNKKGRCENCISAKAFAIQGKLTKFEFVEQEAYFVVAIYTEIEGVAYVIELVSKLNDEVLFGAYGKDNFIKSIEAYNKKLYIDSLTGAYNRLYYDEQLKKMPRFNGVAVLDVDNFKSINDTYGHAAGDLVLKEVVDTASSYIRPSDAVIRLGGDEFLMVFQGISKSTFETRLENIRQTVFNIQILENPELRVSVSIGAIFSTGPTIDLVALADKALYEAKEQRNSVIYVEGQQ